MSQWGVKGVRPFCEYAVAWSGDQPQLLSGLPQV